MSRRTTGPEIERLIQLLAKLPGLGPRSARRAALHLIKNREHLLLPLSAAMAEARDKVTVCSQCGNVDTVDPCTLCTDPRRDRTLSASSKRWATSGRWSAPARGAVFTMCSAARSRPSRAEAGRPRDRPAFRPGRKGHGEGGGAGHNATVEGQTTAHYITERLKEMGIAASRLAHGVPVGGELDYLDEGTLHPGHQGAAAAVGVAAGRTNEKPL